MSYLFHDPTPVTGREWFKGATLMSLGIASIVSAAMTVLAVIEDPEMAATHVVTALFPFVFIILMIIFAIAWFRCARHNRIPDKAFAALEKYAYSLSIFGLIGMVLGLLLPGIILIALCVLIVSACFLFGRFPFRKRHKLRSANLTTLTTQQLAKAIGFTEVASFRRDHNAEIRQKLRAELNSRMERDYQQ